MKYNVMLPVTRKLYFWKYLNVSTLYVIFYVSTDTVSIYTLVVSHPYLIILPIAGNKV